MKLQRKRIIAEQGSTAQLVLGTGDPSLVLCERLLGDLIYQRIKMPSQSMFF